MAIQPIVFGHALVKVNAGAGMEELGYTRSGVAIIIEPKYVDVPSDRYGGEQGTPADIVWLGAIARIRMEFSEYDLAVASKVGAFLAGASAGTLPQPGQLMFNGSFGMRLLIHSASTPLNFPRGMPRGPVETERSSIWAPFISEWEAYPDANRLLYNNTTA